MKRFLFVMCALALSSSLFTACGKKDNDSSSSVRYTGWEIYETDEELVEAYKNDYTEEVDYMPLVESSIFRSFLSDFTDPVNPLNIKGGPYEELFAARPFKFADISLEGKEIIARNVWYVPIVNDGQYVGFISINCRYGEPDLSSYTGSRFIAEKLNTVFEKGDMVMFSTGTNCYGMYEDNTVITFYGDEYSGNMTFDELNQGYNLITPDTVNDIIYAPGSDLDPEEFLRTE